MMNREFLDKALNSLGKGFDITTDFRLKYCKGEGRLILLNEKEKIKLDVPGFGSMENVPIDIKCDKGDRTRYQSDVLEFDQVILINFSYFHIDISSNYIKGHIILYS